MWELALPNGLYEVTAAVGDASFSSTYTLNVEGVNYWNSVALAAGDFRVKTLQVKSGQMKLASAGPSPVMATVSEAPETSGSVPSRTDLPAQPLNHGTGQGILGVLPASSLSPSNAQKVAVANSAPRAETQQIQRNGAIKPAAHSGWIIQVGALETEKEARQRLDAARGSASRLLSDADPFTETVSKGSKTFYRARFAGLNQDSAEAACRTLKRSDISCIAIRN